eukprot:g16623.t1
MSNVAGDTGWGLLVLLATSGLMDVPAAFVLWLGFQVDEHFRAPLFSTSFIEFWGSRWNLTAVRLLREGITPINFSCFFNEALASDTSNLRSPRNDIFRSAKALPKPPLCLGSLASRGKPWNSMEIQTCSDLACCETYCCVVITWFFFRQKRCSASALALHFKFAFPQERHFLKCKAMARGPAVLGRPGKQGKAMEQHENRNGQ